ncbi:hypothetical protein [Streptococcus parasalivarius]
MEASETAWRKFKELQFLAIKYTIMFRFFIKIYKKDLLCSEFLGKMN